MQKMMNMLNICKECENCMFEDKEVSSVDKAMKAIEKSELLIREVTVDLLDAARYLMLDMLEEEKLGDVAVMMLLDREGDYSIVTEDEMELKYPEKEFSEVAVIYDEQLIAAFDPDDVVTLRDVDYLVGPMLVYEMDEDGNDRNIDKDTIMHAVDYAYCNEVQIQVEDQSIPAFRLI